MIKAVVATAFILGLFPQMLCAEDRRSLGPEPGDPTYHSALGDQHLEDGRYEQAIVEYRKVLGLLPKAVDARVQIGFAYEKLGSRAQAHTLFRDAISIYPDFAEDSFRIAIKVNPNNAEAHYGLGLSLAARDIYDFAALAYEEAVRCDPGHAEAHLELGKAYSELQEKGLVRRELEILQTIDQILANELELLL